MSVVSSLDCRYFRNEILQKLLDIIFSYKTLYVLPCLPRTKWPTNSRTVLLDITSYKKDKIRLLKIGRNVNMDFTSIFFADSFCTRLCLNVFGGKFLREAILNFLSKKLSAETLCKFFQIFPPKVLVYIGQNFC